MKKLLFLFILLPFTLNALGQKRINGTFCDFEVSYGSECLTLTDSGTFIMDGSSCFGNYFGKGTYRISHDTLILMYLDNDMQANEIRFLEEKYSISDTLLFHVRAINKDQEVIPFTEVSFYQQYPKEKDIAPYKVLTDLNGTSRIKIPKSENVEFIRIWYVGKKSIIKKILPGNDYSIQAEINMSDTSFLTDGFHEYKLREINQDLIQIGRLDWEELKMVDMERIEKE